MQAMPEWRTPKAQQLRYCGKVALAAVAAYAFTVGDKSEYALYSVLGAALVVGGSVGEDLDSSLNRIRGTLVGAVVGGALAFTIGKSVWSLAIGVASLAWLCLGLGWGTSALRVAIAMALVLVFSHVDDAAEYGIWRVLNTLIGVAIGVVVSRLVWPVLGRHEVSLAIDRALAATSNVLAAVARGMSSDAMLPLQREVLDAMASVRKASTHARLAQQLDRSADALGTQTMHVARAAIDTLGLSVRLDELVNSGAPAEQLREVRDLIAMLAAQARNDPAEPLANFTTLHQDALRRATQRDDASERALVTAILNHVQQIHLALHSVRR